MKLLYSILLLAVPIALFSQSSVQLSEAELQSFSARALNLTKDLSYYIVTIADKSVTPTEKAEAKKLATNLFLSPESCIMQVSSINSSKIANIPIAQYFERLQRLRYSKVDIEWYDITYADSPKLGSDGKYYGTITVFQKFSGFNAENQPVYQDITQKNFYFHFDQVTIDTIDGMQLVWVIKLCDVQVRETSS